MNRRGGLVTKRRTCPECGHVNRYREQRGIRRFRRRMVKCSNCGEIC